MTKGAFSVSVGVFFLLTFSTGVSSEEGFESRHLILKFSDPGPAAIHSLQARTSDNPNAVWSVIPANVSLSQDALSYQATLEVPDVRWGIFRVKRQASDHSGALRVLEVKTAPANGPLFAVDAA